MVTKAKLKSQLDAVLYFLRKMDADMVTMLLDDKYTYQDYSRSTFSRKLGDLFFEFSEKGDFLLNIEKGTCIGCSKGAKGFSFIGNKSKAFIDLVFIVDENEKILDIFECDELCNRKPNLKKNMRLYLESREVFDLIEDEDFMDDDDYDPFFGDDDIPF